MVAPEIMRGSLAFRLVDVSGHRVEDAEGRASIHVSRQSYLEVFEKDISLRDKEEGPVVDADTE